jgi:hypothetical protein
MFIKNISIKAKFEQGRKVNENLLQNFLIHNLLFGKPRK